MKKDGLRKSQKCVEDLFLSEYSRRLIVGARDTLHCEAAAPVVSEEPLRMQIETAPDVMTIELRRFKERNH
jgi:hypothetical protein